MKKVECRSLILKRPFLFIYFVYFKTILNINMTYKLKN